MFIEFTRSHSMAKRWGKGRLKRGEVHTVKMQRVGSKTFSDRWEGVGKIREEREAGSSDSRYGEICSQ